MDLRDVATAVGGVTVLDGDLGRRLYDHVRRTQPERVLELGTGPGMTAAYLAAALDCNDFGRLTTVGHEGVTRERDPEQLLVRIGLAARVEVVHARSSYNWFLKELVQQASNIDGSCEPCYDFVHLRGPQDFSTEGLAVILIERLLRPDGWLLLSGLESSPLQSSSADDDDPLSETEHTEPHGVAVFELIVRNQPSFTHLMHDEAGDGWAQKRAGVPRPHQAETGRPLGASVAAELRRRGWPLRRSGGGRS
jgi:predicted O-methyltransferase YrrM